MNTNRNPSQNKIGREISAGPVRSGPKTKRPFPAGEKWAFFFLILTSFIYLLLPSIHDQLVRAELAGPSIDSFLNASGIGLKVLAALMALNSRHIIARIICWSLRLLGRMLLWMVSLASPPGAAGLAGFGGRLGSAAGAAWQVIDRFLQLPGSGFKWFFKALWLVVVFTAKVIFRLARGLAVVLKKVGRVAHIGVVAAFGIVFYALRFLFKLFYRGIAAAVRSHALKTVGISLKTCGNRLGTGVAWSFKVVGLAVFIPFRLLFKVLKVGAAAFSKVLKALFNSVAFLAKIFSKILRTVAVSLWKVFRAFFRFLASIVVSALRLAAGGVAAIWRSPVSAAAGRGLRQSGKYLLVGIAWTFKAVGLTFGFTFKHLSIVIKAMAVLLAKMLKAIFIGAVFLARLVYVAVRISAVTLWKAIKIVFQAIVPVVAWLPRSLGRGAAAARSSPVAVKSGRHLWKGFKYLAIGFGWTIKRLAKAIWFVIKAIFTGLAHVIKFLGKVTLVLLRFSVRRLLVPAARPVKVVLEVLAKWVFWLPIKGFFSLVWKVIKASGRLKAAVFRPLNRRGSRWAGLPGGAFSTGRSRNKLVRWSLTGVIIVALYFGTAALAGWWPLNVPTVTVVQWANGHLMRPGLLNDMTKQFNSENHLTQSGQRIRVQVVSRDSGLQADDLLSRVTKNLSLEESIPDPTIVSPSSAEWLSRVTQGAGRLVVDPSNSRSISRVYVGIVTYRDMAEALGWPDKQLGYADIIALRNDPRGWAGIPGSRVEWGRKPLLSFTDPTTSSTGRSVLFSLYAIAAGKTVDQLALADVNDPKVVGYVKDFQKLIDHYMTGTIPQNTRVYEGPRYGHFFMMPEDDLVHLYDGGESALVNGTQVKAPPINRSMVMLYPKEGTMVFNNIAGIVDAPWVTPDQKEAAGWWVDYLLQDQQQRAFMDSGFRPGGNLSLTDEASKITSRYGLTAAPGTPLLTPERIDPAVASLIEGAWQEVKRPAVVTFVMDTSGSMLGEKLDQAKQGLERALDSMAPNNEVGLLTFSETVHDTVPVGPLKLNRSRLDQIISGMTARGETAVYDAIKAAVEITDQANGDDGAIRAVVVLTDGQTNRGVTHLDDLITLISSSEVEVAHYSGFEGDNAGTDAAGRTVSKKDIIGSSLALPTKHQVQVFFIGIGNDADMEIGRMLTQATGAEFQKVTAKDLAQVLETFSKYF